MHQSNVIPFILPDPSPQSQDYHHRITHGRVENVLDDKYVVRLEDGRVVRAGVAHGCLAVPGVGDMVLTYAGPGKVAYVLTVLESRQTETVLETDRDLVLKAPRVRLEGGESLALSAPDVDLSGIRGRLGFLNLDLTASALTARIGHMGAFVETIRLKARSLIQTLRYSLRRVQGMDASQAGQMRVKVEESYKLKTGAADLRAEGTMSVDGKRVDIG
ncbi:DUF3540 domain-containing protein [Desulfonatronum sp. SC1]|uniref:DUF3540 domain-containing protein n=1 Tax=Desulfonatronum sp. SC1 TaxID=2109626 RepID=UPI000D2FDDCE|nr:DUF3540 domain-containing protein [Desulfonatronum sp. SC1]PTN32703.1 hypothetical protein C6366_16205 [Desulfonatronum sp. SC1]